MRERLISGNESGRLSQKFSRANQQQQLVLRGLCFAIVDEADSVLIDEARTPLILSKEHHDDSQRQIYQQALAFARQMQEPRDYRLSPREHTLELTDTGRDWLAGLTGDMSGVWAGQRHARFLVHQALCALHLFQRDAHYLVRAGKIEIIDRHTGRTMADRTWQRGLHQMIECKENCDMTGQRETLASISYQQFFGRYLRLGGMSGTLHPAAAELRAVYQQRVVAIPPHRPCQRHETDFVLHRRASDKWLAVFSRIEKVHATGQPVLVGTGSVHDSELLGFFLGRRGLDHRVLNARQDQEEAETIALAGQCGQITIATSMAGRGTDIKLGPGVAELGGLHVISTECHEEYRVDRQLRGRCARQGDPGSTQTHISLQDSLIADFYAPGLLRLLDNYLARGMVLPQWLRRSLARLPQRMISRLYRADRRDLMRLNENLGKMLAYSGKRE